MSAVFGSRITAIVTLKSMSPYSQSRAHEEPLYKNEDKGDYDNGHGGHICMSRTAAS